MKFESTDTYRPTAYDNLQWDWKHRPTSGGPGMGGGEQTQPYVAADLGSAIRKNPHLRVFSANGYFDLATPFFSTEYDLSHMDLDPSLRGNVQFGYYPSGHMIYLNVEALHQLKDDSGRIHHQSDVKLERFEPENTRKMKKRAASLRSGRTSSGPTARWTLNRV